MTWLIGWKEKAIALGLTVLVFLGWIFKIKKEAEAKGAQKVKDQIRRETEKKRNEWQKIDDTPIGVDAALDSLRQRSSRESGNP